MIHKSNKFYHHDDDEEDNLQIHHTVVQSITNRIRVMEPFYEELVPDLFGLDFIDTSCFSIENLVDRFQQFYYENEVIVPAVANSFAIKDYSLLGKLVDWSHKQTIELLENTLPETEWLPNWARGIVEDNNTRSDSSPKCERVYALAASVFGAGFGGSCWALVRKDEALSFLNQWRDAYEVKFPSQTCDPDNLPREFFIMRPGQGALSFG
uniref:GHMP kinase C-terminal domain-containing protein n=1 Tax=Eucampia antarctica TaxID=49252 RepID=A0A7S2RGE8_9STRA|mmetsp:Transcript_21726/g.20863  ORF Transcript_21726/g.20863 Transcript_21726/m.20863 type:complete len:210 (+) Transcript_21726:363-992(+)|eukprot:CAMPEP_0197827330 /NCGR_PEP_ID=MMETSP1437-20131217/4132_1 /TAXON_ID=49252 ORGANISM="Eucampia antarctica, Strain CCMP1452" /NCGR_SAMPLE_ID=MMETSP1437 /ASSEMBLY_ACC=CAM_ASM_001096 /LENGTH=209 /DNA_ID=CAMNT_0043428131 /DNA_START=162 /DNA_END=791 /DNA_ORIENTATION=+